MAFSLDHRVFSAAGLQTMRSEVQKKDRFRIATKVFTFYFLFIYFIEI